MPTAVSTGNLWSNPLPEGSLRPILLIATSLMLSFTPGCVDVHQAQTEDKGPDRGGDVPPDKDPPISDDTDELAPVSCDVVVQWVQPEDGARFVDRASTITVSLSSPIDDTPFELLVHQSEDELVTGTTTVSDDGTVLTFKPAEPLEPGHFHQLTITACEEEVTSGFTTLTAPIDLALLQQDTWGLPFTDVQWVSPSGAGLIFESLIDNGELLIEVVDVNPYYDTIALAASWSGMCSEVVIDDVDISGNPWIDTGAFDLEIELGLGFMRAEDVMLAGVLSADGGGLDYVEATANIDSRDMDEWLGMNLCDLGQALGTSCVPCADSTIACLPIFLHADGVGATALSNAQTCPE